MKGFRVGSVAALFLVWVSPQTLGSEIYEHLGGAFTLAYSSDWEIDPDSDGVLNLNYGGNEEIVAIINYGFNNQFSDIPNAEFYSELKSSFLHDFLYRMWGSMGDFKTDFIEKRNIGHLQGYVGSFTLTYGKKTNKKGKKKSFFSAITFDQGHFFSVLIIAFPKDAIDLEVEGYKLLEGLTINP